MLSEQLATAWAERCATIAIDQIMRFSDEGLVLGAGTVVAASGGSGRDISVDQLDQRLPALLSAAHLSQPTDLALRHLRKAAEYWSEGQDALAEMHLAISGVSRLKEPRAGAHRLFLADALMKLGLEAQDIVEAVRIAPAALGWLRKDYNADEPRVPAGSGRPSGQWTSDGSASGGSEAEVNPDSVTPAIDYAGPLACKVAQNLCIQDTIDEALAMYGDAANDNADHAAVESWRAEETGQCRKAGLVCEELSAIVHYTPFLIRAAVRFPDGGLVVSDKNITDDMYFARHLPRRIPPTTIWHPRT